MKWMAGTVASVLGCLAASAEAESAPKGVTFEQQVKPILQRSCVDCHGAKQAKAKLRLDSLEGVLKGSEDGKVVLPGESAKSALIRAVTGTGKKAMPPKPKPGRNDGYKPVPLSPEEIVLLRAWVDQGAK